MGSLGIFVDTSSLVPGKELRYLLKRGWVGPSTRPHVLKQRRNFMSQPVFEPRTAGCAARSPVSLYRLCCLGSNNNNNKTTTTTTITDRCGNTCSLKCCAKGSGKEVKIQEIMYRDTTNVEPEMYYYTSNNWSHWNNKEKLKEMFGSCTRKTFDRFTTKDCYTWNITHNTESVKFEA